MEQIRIKDLAGQLIAMNFRGDGGIAGSNVCAWSRRVVSHAFECDEDDITTIENDDGEFIAVNGQPVAYFEVGHV